MGADAGMRIGTMPYVLVANEALPVHSLQDMVALAKARPGELNYASIGIGSGWPTGS